MKNILLAMISTFTISSSAEQALQCRLAVFFSDLPDGIMEQSFNLPLYATGSHGGEPKEINFANGHKVSILADAKWLGIDWYHGEEHIAEVVTVIGNFLGEPRALVVYSPENSNYHADLSCEVSP